MFAFKVLNIDILKNAVIVKKIRFFSIFVPNSNYASDSDIDSLRSFITESKSLIVLTGAGVSTESGIPGY